MQRSIQGKMWKLWYPETFCERITVKLALKNNQINTDNENEEEKVEDEWECEVSEAVQMTQPNYIAVTWPDDTFKSILLDQIINLTKRNNW